MHSFFQGSVLRDIDMRVAVHRNLTTNKWVISSAKVTRNGERKGNKSGDIAKGAESVTLTDVHFTTCSQKSIDRIKANILDKSKSAGREVVAYAIGTLVDFDSPVQLQGGKHVSWNPLKGKDFYLVDSGQTVTGEVFRIATFSEVMKCVK